MLESCGISEEHVAAFEQKYDENFGATIDLGAHNIVNERKFEVRTPDVTIQVNPERSDLVQTRIIDGFKYILIRADEGVEVNGLFIKPFKTSHDCADGRGYIVTGSDGSSKVAVATDTGIVTPEIINSITGCNLVYIESNHDVNMLKNGSYHFELKKRILSDKGHLSNDACAEVLRALVNKGTTQFVLAHLSEENNTPHLAYDTSINALLEMGALVNRDFQLRVAEPENNSKAILV
jgi:phosphoribosyl 1,2-cyclic phosphodiesterase